jgi:hypothetical protein
LKYTDPSGNIFWIPIIAAAVVFGGTNLAIQANNGNVNSFGDGLKAFGAGALVGAALATGVGFGLTVPFLGTTIKAAGWIYGGSTVLSGLSGVYRGTTTGDWSRLQNTGKIFLGNFYLDENRDFGEQILQGLSRFTWELPQHFGGYNYTQLRNTFGGVDRVDYFGGATFATKENAGYNDGISLGNYINVNIINKISGGFTEWVINDPLYMHEYGHTFDSQIYGLSYLFAVGIPSVMSANDAVYDPNTGGSSHDVFWTERRANRHAASYFRKHYNIDWNRYEIHNNPFGYYPR